MLWLDREILFELRNLISTYNALTDEKRRIVNRHAEALYILCKNNHLIKIGQETFSTFAVRRRRRKYSEVPDTCPVCGEKIVEVIHYKPRFDIRKIVEELDRLRNEIARQALSLIKDHPVYRLWLSRVKGIGDINSARLIYLLETQRDLSKPSTLMARTGAYFVAICERCRVYFARNVPPPPHKILCPQCGQEMERTIPGKWLTYYKPLDWKPPVPASAGGRNPVPYDPRMRDIVYKTVTGIYVYTLRFALPRAVKGSEHVPWYGVWTLHKITTSYMRYLSENRTKPYLKAFSAGVYSTAKVLLTHLWLVGMCLRYPDKMEEFWERRLPKTVRDQGHQGTVPFVDDEEHMYELYDKIVPDKYRHLIDHTYSDLRKMLDTVMDMYRERKLQKIATGIEQEYATSRRGELEKLGLEKEGIGE